MISLASYASEYHVHVGLLEKYKYQYTLYSKNVDTMFYIVHWSVFSYSTVDIGLQI